MFIRNCPDCGKELSYNKKWALNRAIKTGGVCKSCSQKGKTYSKEVRHKISISKGGAGKLDQKWPGLRAWANRVKERDEYVCQHCYYDGLPEEMDAHHIVPKSKFPQYAYDLDNGQTLCKQCHRIEHYKRPTTYDSSNI